LLDYAEAAVKILNQAKTREVRLTGLKLVEALMGRGAPASKLTGWQVAIENDREQAFSNLLFS
jgi:hypothetical protein